MKIEDILAADQCDPQNPPQLVRAFEAELKWFGSKRHAKIAWVQFDKNSSNFYVFWRFEEDDGAWALVEGELPHRIATINTLGVFDEQKLLQKIKSAIGSKLFCRLFYLEELEQYVSINKRFGSFYKSIGQYSRTHVTQSECGKGVG